MLHWNWVGHMHLKTLAPSGSLGRHWLGVGYPKEVSSNALGCISDHTLEFYSFPVLITSRRWLADCLHIFFSQRVLLCNRKLHISKHNSISQDRPVSRVRYKANFSGWEGEGFSKVGSFSLKLMPREIYSLIWRFWGYTCCLNNEICLKNVKSSLKNCLAGKSINLSWFWGLMFLKIEKVMLARHVHRRRLLSGLLHDLMCY